MVISKEETVADKSAGKTSNGKILSIGASEVVSICKV